MAAPLIPTGVSLALQAADPSYDFEIQRATDSSGTGAITIVSGLSGSQTQFIDTQPLDGVARWYRARQTGQNATASDWTAWIPGIPAVIQPGMQMTPLVMPGVRPRVIIARIATGQTRGTANRLRALGYDVTDDGLNTA